MDKRRFNAYRRRIIALKEARGAYIEAEIEHLRFRENGSTGELPKRLEAKLRKFMNQCFMVIESTDLNVMNDRLPHDENDHYEGDGCLSNEK